MPEVLLPNYKKIAKENKKEEPADITDKEVEDFILRIRKERAHDDLHESGSTHDDHNPENISEEKLPPLTDESVAKIGAFKTVAEFKEKVKENLTEDKTHRLKEKNRLQIIDAIIKETKVSVPIVLIEIEIENMLARFKSDLQNMGMNFDEYIKKVGKTEESIRNEMKGDAKKRAIIQLVVHHIAKKENITANKEKLEAEVKKVVEAYKDADEAYVRQYFDNILTNEEVFTFLENQ